MSIVLTFAWRICIVYSTIPLFWFLIHPRAEYWRARRRSPYVVLVPLWIAIWIVFGWATSPWRHVRVYETPWTWVPAIALFVTGFWLYRQSGRVFSHRQLIGAPEILPDHGEQRLVTTGIRAHVRHPVYLAHLCELLGWSIGTGLAVCYALTAFAIVTGAVMIRMEDQELERRFGEEYSEYRRRVPAVLPRPL